VRQVPARIQGAPLGRRPEQRCASATAARARVTALEDFILREKIFHFDHERIPERVVHARGYGAHGYSRRSRRWPSHHAPTIFQRRRHTHRGVRPLLDGRRQPRLARPRPRRARLRGQALHQEGNWDIVGNNIPVFFIQDAIKFPDLVHSVKEEPDRGFPQAQSAHDNFWDFISLMPEATHMIMWTMSDRAIPRSFRFMEGFGVHTFRW
jgi:catalase